MKPRRPADAAEGAIDRGVSRRFWETQALAAADLRSVTLASSPAFLDRLELSLYQGWFLRRLAAVGLRPRLVVDVGCGSGQWTVLFAGIAERVIAVDFAEGFVAECRRRLEVAGLAERVELGVSDAMGVVFPPGCDLVVCGAVTQYLSDDEITRLLGRARQALGPDGVVYVRTTVAKRRDRLAKQSDEFQGIYRSMDWYEAQFAAAGLAVVERWTATRFVPEEIAARTLRILSYPLRAYFRLIRMRLSTDIAMYLLRPG